MGITNNKPAAPAHARKALACAVMLGCASLCLTPAQAAPGTAATASQAQLIGFDIPGQALDDALASYGLASGVQVLYGSTLTAGLSSSPVSGKLTREQALAQLLAGTGLTYQFTAEGSVTVHATRHAQTLQIAPVMVSGEKIARPLEKTLTSVVVNTAEDLRAHGDHDLNHVFARTPGVYTQSGNENWGIRGVPVSGFDEQGPATLNGAVSVFVDGAQQTNRSLTLSPLPLWDVEQVEVLLGPQSTTQGRNSLAGAVVIQTRNPTFEPSLAAQTNVGNYGEQGAALAVGGALIDQVVAGRLAVDYQQGDGYIDNVTTGDDANIRRNSNIRGKLLVLPNDDLDVLLTYAHSNNRQGENSSFRQNGRVHYYKTLSNTKAYDRLEQDTLSAKLDYRLDENWTLTSLSTVTQNDYDALLDFDQSATRNQEVVRTQETRMFSEELRMGYDDGDTVKAFVGAYYGHTRNDFHDQLFNNAALLAVVKGDTLIRNQALFGEINWTFQPRWTLITGLRYDREQNDTDIERDDISMPGDVSKTFNALLPKIGIDHELADNQYIGFMVQKGYRGGGVNVRSGSTHEAYDPEYTTNYELSYRGAWNDNSLRARVNLYYTDWKDQQVSMLDPTGNFFEVHNAGRSDIRGLEAFIEQDVNHQLSLNAGISYTDGRYRDFVFGSNSDLSGESFLFSPKYKVSVGGNYRFDNGLMIGTDIVYQDGAPSQYQFDADGKVSQERKSDHYVLVNLNAEYALTDQLTLSGFTKNLFDKQYITNNRPDGIIDVGAPRTLGLQLRYDM